MAVTETSRLVAVLGYSVRGADDLHSLCLLRLRHAEQLAHGAKAVVLSGWSRRRSRSGEAELMRATWRGPNVPLVCDTTARDTVQNASGIASLARQLAADEVIVVTSQWHAPRARALVRAALRDTAVSVRTSSPRGDIRPGLLMRELACLAALPYQLLRVRARADA